MHPSIHAKCAVDQDLSTAMVETKNGGEEEGVHLSSLRTDTPRTNCFCIRVKQEWVKRESGRVFHETTTTRGGRGGRYVMRRVMLFKVMVFVRFESDSPTVFKGKRDRVILGS